MQSVFALKRCLLFQRDVRVENLDQLDPLTILPPGDRCLLCSIKTGEAGVDGNGVVRLDASLRLNPITKVVESNPDVQQSGKVACRYECRVPAKVRIEMM